MDVPCPVCGFPLASPDDNCPRCALVQATPPAVRTGPVETDVGRLQERRLLARSDQDVRRSLRMLLAIGVGLILLLFAVTTVIVWLLFGA